MSVLTKVGPKYQVTVPKQVPDQLRLRPGDLLEVRVAGRHALLLPKMLVDRNPELETDLAEAEQDIKAGRVYGPYDAKDVLKGLAEAVRQERRRAKTRATKRSRAKARSHAGHLGRRARGLHR
jgi:AbrB family looped-hinge helix DNA binding protein